MEDPIELAAIERGSGDAVALVHGGVFHSGPAWAQSIGALAGAGYRVIAVDRRGHGHSDAGDADFISVHLHADDLRLTLELRDARPVHLVGVSYGALVCLEFALSWPDRVTSMTLVEPALFAWAADDPDMGVWLERFDEIAASAAAGAPMTEWVPRWLTLIDSRMAKEITPDSPSWSLIRKQGPLIFKEEPGWRYQPDRGLINHLFVPTLVLNGDQSEPPVQMIGEMLAEELPLGTHEWIAGAGHALHATAPETFNETLLDFILKTSANRPA